MDKHLSLALRFLYHLYTTFRDVTLAFPSSASLPSIAIVHSGDSPILAKIKKHIDQGSVPGVFCVASIGGSLRALASAMETRQERR